MAATLDGFCKIDGVDGPSTAKGHEGWIEILRFEHQLSQATTARSASGAGPTERVSIEDFMIRKALDKTSPKLYLLCCQGEVIPKVTVELARAVGKQETFMQWVFSDVVISGVNPSGGGSASSGDDEGESFPTETVSFNASAVDWSYTPFKKDGSRDAAIMTGWDLTTNASKA